MDDPTLREPWLLSEFTLDSLRRASSNVCKPCFSEQELRKQVGELAMRLARAEGALKINEQLNETLRSENVELRRELANVRSCSVQLDRVDEMILGGPSVGDE